MGKIYVYSTLTCDHIYPLYKEKTQGSGINQIKKDTNGKSMSMLIKGGANTANKHLVTPQGVVTEVDSDLFESLKDTQAFKRHIKRGFISVQKTKVDPEKVAKNMRKKDKSAPLTPEDYKDPPKTGTV